MELWKIKQKDGPFQDGKEYIAQTLMGISGAMRGQ
jgi:hypothetical protein